MISPEDTKETNTQFQECSGRDGEASQRSHALNGDVNRNQTDENASCSIKISRKDELKGLDEYEKYSKTPTDVDTDLQPSLEDSDYDMGFEENSKCSLCIHPNTYRAVT